LETFDINDENKVKDLGFAPQPRKRMLALALLASIG